LTEERALAAREIEEIQAAKSEQEEEKPHDGR
jgi:hypothetical protein